MAFILRFGLYELTVLPFGLYNTPSIFQCHINYIFGDIIDQYILVYLDGILLYS